jgi:hypothetical protein
VYSLAEAAEAVGRGKPALIKAIQKGRISARKNEKGEWFIDPSELHRVYPPVKQGTDAEAVPGVREEAVEELAVLRQVNALLSVQVEDFKAERNRLIGIIENQTRLITHMAEKPTEPARRGWWQRLTGKG